MVTRPAVAVRPYLPAARFRARVPAGNGKPAKLDDRLGKQDLERGPKDQRSGSFFGATERVGGGRPFLLLKPISSGFCLLKAGFYGWP